MLMLMMVWLLIRFGANAELVFAMSVCVHFNVYKVRRALTSSPPTNASNKMADRSRETSPFTTIWIIVGGGHTPPSGKCKFLTLSCHLRGFEFLHFLIRQPFYTLPVSVNVFVERGTFCIKLYVAVFRNNHNKNVLEWEAKKYLLT